MAPPKKNNGIKRFKGYKGNPNLKHVGVEVDWTPELLDEYIKCSQDPLYFCETYMKIIHVDKGEIPFILHDYQKEMLQSMVDNRYTIITTARQVGKSTTTCGYILWYIIFNPEKTVALLANKGETAREILGKIRFAYEHLPKWLQQGVVEWNKGSIALENESRVIAAATSASAIRGYAISLLFIDEAAHILNWDEFFTSVFPTISSGDTTKIVLVSTPNGLNHFHTTWVGAKEHRNGYNAIEVIWSKVPGRDEKWKEQTLAAMDGDTEKFAQEHECEFLGSSGTLIAGWKLKELMGAYIRPEYSQNNLNIYIRPQPNRLYTLVADVSRGKGLDYSAFIVLDITEMPYKQVASFSNNQVTPIEYADVIYQTARGYNNAYVLIEINDIGGQVSDILYHEYEYEMVLHTEYAGRAGKRITAGFGNGTKDRGIRTTKLVKNIGCSLMKVLVEQNQVILYDEKTVNELATFSKKGSSYEAEQGMHDDLAMCLLLFSWMTDQEYFKELTNINTISELREKSLDEIEQDYLPVGFISDGHEVFNDEPLTVSSREFDMWGADASPW